MSHDAYALRGTSAVKPTAVMTIAAAIPTIAPILREKWYRWARTPRPTRNATPPERIAVPDSSVSTPVDTVRTPAAMSANEVSRVRVMPGAKSGPVSKPTAQPSSTAHRMTDIPACPNPRSATVGCARMPTAPSTAKRMWQGQALATCAPGLAIPARSRTCAPVSGSCTPPSGVFTRSTTTPTVITRLPSSRSQRIAPCPPLTPPSSCAA